MVKATTRARGKRPDPARIALGRAVVALREARGLSTTALAKLAGLSQQSLYAIEHGGGANFDTVRLLAHALQVTVQAIDDQLPDPRPRQAPVRNHKKNC